MTILALVFAVVGPGAGAQTTAADRDRDRNQDAQVAEALDLTRAVVVAPKATSFAEESAVEMLIDEVEKRTGVHWSRREQWPSDQTPVISVGRRDRTDDVAGPHQAAARAAMTNPGKEGFTLLALKQPSPAVLVLGNDARGVLFGVGKLLRQLRLGRGRATLPPISHSTAPMTPLRGHQLGYRPKTNSYDAWSLPMWEQYYRDLVVFGSNAIELIPPRSDDDDDSPHFPLPKETMMEGMSRIADKYDLDVWIWYPALDADYSKPETVRFALHEWGAIFDRLPRIDAVFVPTGDPGNTPPRLLLPMLAQQSKRLRQKHANATMWISVQSLTEAGMSEIMSLLNGPNMDWLEGIVFGPQTRLPLADLRRVLPARYPIRRYPDITHSLRSEYPVPAWDLAFALTEGREVINPRPRDEAIIFRAHDRDTIGFISYSEGCNDDVNKMVWSALGWDRNADIPGVLREYARYFVSDRLSEPLAQGLLALERNWKGPLLTNGQVSTTIDQFRGMEKSATPAEKQSWRFQQALYRAYYDSFTRSRLIEETEREERALDALRQSLEVPTAVSTLSAMDAAERILAEPTRNGLADRARVFELAEALFQSIRMQLSVPRYQAIEAGRGDSLDGIDVPLNNRGWIKDRLAQLRSKDEVDRRRGIREIVQWTDPGPGGFYDDLGNPSRQPHFLDKGSYDRDPGFLVHPNIGFRNDPSWRRSWCTHVDGQYGTPVEMKYEGLDPTARYRLRLVYGGESRAKVRLRAGETEIHSLMDKPFPIRPFEVDVPAEATRSGSLHLVWEAQPGRGGPGRGVQLAEAWLINTSFKAK